MAYFKTPAICKLRSEGGTFYSFGSATEDIGLNINERNNKVSLSNYVLLNIPDASSSSTSNALNLNNIISSDYMSAYNTTANLPNLSLIPESFQGYALNFETVLRNSETYDQSDTRTVSERVFWKWLKKTGALKVRSVNDASTYYVEGSSSDASYSSVVVGYGKISTAAQRTDNYNVYNETLIQVPTSFGQTHAVFKNVQDNNYNDGNYIKIPSGGLGVLENHETGDISGNGLFNHAYYDVSNATGGEYDVATATTTSCDALSMVFDPSIIKEYTMADNAAYDSISTLDDIAIYSTEEKFKFNAVLVYYSIYDTNKNSILATNLLGILLLDTPVTTTGINTGTTIDITLPRFEKRKSTGTGFGTSFSFRLNISTKEIYDNTSVTISDNTTSESSVTEDFNETIANLNAAIQKLESNSSTISTIASNYLTIKNLINTQSSTVTTLEKNVKNILNGKSNTTKTSTLYAKYVDASYLIVDPSMTIVDSSNSEIEQITTTKDSSGNSSSLHTFDCSVNFTQPIKTGDISVGRSNAIYVSKIYSPENGSIGISYEDDADEASHITIDASGLHERNVFIDTSNGTSYLWVGDSSNIQTNAGILTSAYDANILGYIKDVSILVRNSTTDSSKDKKLLLYNKAPSSMTATADGSIIMSAVADSSEYIGGSGYLYHWVDESALLAMIIRNLQLLNAANNIYPQQ